MAEALSNLTLNQAVERLARIAYAAYRQYVIISSLRPHYPDWDNATPEQRAAAVGETHYWMHHLASNPGDKPRQFLHGQPKGLVEQQLYKGVVESLRMHTPPQGAHLCPRRAALQVTTDFACARESGHKGPCLPVWVDPETVEDVTPGRTGRNQIRDASPYETAGVGDVPKGPRHE